MECEGNSVQVILMAVYIVTGKLGGGKSLLTIEKIRQKLMQGCIVATNIDLNLQHLCGYFAKTPRVIRLPDKPTIYDLNVIGSGNESYDESKNGILALDECGTWFNSRDWNDKSRKPVNDWFLHARKLGWDVYLIIQDIDLLDSQARKAIAEHTVFCKRLDRLTIPFLSMLFKLISGKTLPLPRYHVARVVYGISPTDAVADRWGARGTELYKAYDTKQLFLDNYPHGTHSLLTPWLQYGRYMVPRDWRFYMRMTKIYFKRFKPVIALTAGLLTGVAMSLLVVLQNQYQPIEPVKVSEVKTEVIDTPLFEDIYIVGMSKINGRISYQFAQGDHTDTVYTSTDLANMGFKVEQQNECSALIGYLDKVQPVTCKLHL